MWQLVSQIDLSDSKDLSEFWILWGLLRNFWWAGRAYFLVLTSIPCSWGWWIHALQTSVTLSDTIWPTPFYSRCNSFLLAQKSPPALLLPRCHPPHSRTPSPTPRLCLLEQDQGHPVQCHTNQKEFSTQALKSLFPFAYIIIRPFHTQKRNVIITHAKKVHKIKCVLHVSRWPVTVP